MNFNRSSTKELAYTENGFRHWKNALDAQKGFPKHEKTLTHIEAMKMWKEKDNRMLSCSSVSTLVNDKTLEKHRYYIKSIVEVVQFLAVNELALRGNYDIDEYSENGLFGNLFEYTLKKDAFLRECASIIPKNATYCSPEIQNSIIECMVEEVRKCIVDDLNNADVPYFTLLEDGTRDKNNRENIAIGLRYVKEGLVTESLLSIVTTKELDAETFAQATLNELNASGINPMNMLSQCYDGASVMSGVKNGVAALIEKKLEKPIPYVHCFNHRLHLVLVKTISDILLVKHFFEHCALLHSFFHHPKVQAIYAGKTIVRLLEQRWSGHYQITNTIFSNYREIIRTLYAIPNDKQRFNGEDIAKSIGIKSVMMSIEFRFCLSMCKKILGLLHPADQILQAPKSSLRDGLQVIKTVMNKIETMRTDLEYSSLISEAQNVLFEAEDGETDNTEAEIEIGRGKRKSNPITIKDFVIMERLPSNKKAASDPMILCQTPMKQEYFETIDKILLELNSRFGSKEELILAVSTVQDLDITKLQPLLKLGIVLPLPEELLVVKTFLSKLRQEEKARLDEEESTSSDHSKKRNKWTHRKNDMELLFPFKEAFKTTYELLASVETLGCSTASCESTFSTLTAINRPQRLSMGHQRMANLVFLAVEHKRTQAIDMNKVLLNFSKKRTENCKFFEKLMF